MFFTILQKKDNEEGVSDSGPRIFEAYASYEDIDKQKDIVKIDALLETMKTWFKRGAPIMDSHTNRHVGRGLKADNATVNGKKAAWMKAEIFKDYKVDEIVWEKIQNGNYKGVSIGGSTENRHRECTEKECHYVIPDLELFEISVVEEPANPMALIIAKEKKEVKVEKMSAEEKIEKTESVEKEYCTCKHDELALEEDEVPMEEEPMMEEENEMEAVSSEEEPEEELPEEEEKFAALEAKIAELTEMVAGLVGAKEASLPKPPKAEESSGNIHDKQPEEREVKAGKAKKQTKKVAPKKSVTTPRPRIEKRLTIPTQNLNVGKEDTPLVTLDEIKAMAKKPGGMMELDRLQKQRRGAL